MKTGNGFLFTLDHIHPVLKKYPNVDVSPYKEQLEEWSKECTRHILQTFGAVTGSLASYAQEFDLKMNEIPDLAAIFKESEAHHLEAQARDIRENPGTTKYRTTPITW